MAYTLEGRKGGSIRFIPLQNGLIEKESETYNSSVTSNPIENGSSIDDHVNNEAGIFSIVGTIIGGEAAINTLKTMRDSRDVMTYTGHVRITNLVFTSLKFDRSYKNRDGAAFSATFKRVQITSPEYVPSGQSMSMADQDAGKASDRQLAQTSNAGMKTVSSVNVSGASLGAYSSAYHAPSSSAPLTRVTGGYDGLS